MANKRDTSKQKRARQNRAQREALKARTSAASTPSTERRAQAATPARSAPAKQEKRGFFAPDPNRPPRPGDRPVDLDTLEGNWLSKRMQVPGGRQVLTALLMSVVVSITLLITKVPEACPPSLKGKACQTWSKDHMIPYLDRFGSLAILFLGVPILITGIAAAVTLRPNHRKIWRALTFVLAAWVAATITANSIIYLFPVGFLFYGLSRATKVEGPLSRRGAVPAEDDAPADEPVDDAADDGAEADEEPGDALEEADGGDDAER